MVGYVSRRRAQMYPAKSDCPKPLSSGHNLLYQDELGTCFHIHTAKRVVPRDDKQGDARCNAPHAIYSSRGHPRMERRLYKMACNDTRYDTVGVAELSTRPYEAGSGSRLNHVHSAMLR